MRKLMYFFPLLLSACGGGGGEGTSAEPSLTIYHGNFYDSAVENLAYRTASQSGRTNAQGQFSYALDEAIQFTIGDLTFPSVPAQSELTPLALFASDAINTPAVVNTLRLLQSLDVDGDPSNGIRIDDAAHLAAEGMAELDFTASDFATQVAPLVSNSGAIQRELISAEQAIFHFEETLDELAFDYVSGCEQSHPLVGSDADFSSLAHGVSGTATILDDCTIEVTNFEYDASAPLVYFYAALDGQYQSSQAFPVSSLLRSNGLAYQTETIRLRLPNDKSLDDLNSISVWCVEFAVNFGEVNFTL